MNRFFICLAVTSLISLSGHAAGTLLIAGDSWAWLPCLFNSFPQALKKAGSEGTVMACTKTSGMNIHADNWIGRKEDVAMMKILKNHRDVTAVYLSLGGNDFLNDWKVSMSPDEEHQLFEVIRHHVQAVATAIVTARPDVKVLVSGYDFSRLYSENWRISNYKRLYQDSGSPSVHDSQAAFLRFTREMTQVADGKNIFFIHHVGLMHYHHGSTAGGFAPKTTANPMDISPPNSPERVGGNPEFELEPIAMTRVGKYVDAYHLSPKNYFLMAGHSVTHYLKDWLK